MNDKFKAARVTLDTCSSELPHDTYSCLNSSMKFHEGVLDIVAEFNDTSYTLELGEKAMLLAPFF